MTNKIRQTHQRLPHSRCTYRLCVILFLTILLVGCRPAGIPSSAGDEADLLRFPSEDLVEIMAPWQGETPLARLWLSESPAPEKVTPIKTPLRRVVVLSTVYASLIDELGGRDAIVGVADPNFFIPSDPLKALIDSGKIASVGSSYEPSLETIIALKPDAVIMSDAAAITVTQTIAKAGITVIPLTDYLETTPLKRLYWRKLFGRLFSSNDDGGYTESYRKYVDLRTKTASVARRPLVLTERPYQGAWWVPGGNSYISALIVDAGGQNPWADDLSRGSVPLDETAVIDRAANATFWLLKETSDFDKKTLLANYPHAEVFDAFKNNNVLVCNTISTPYYNLLAFHPEAILEEYIRILHPEVLDNGELKFFKRL